MERESRSDSLIFSLPLRPGLDPRAAGGRAGATPTPPTIVTSIVDPSHIQMHLPTLGPCIMYEISEMRRYLPQSGGIVFATQDQAFKLTGFIFTDYADPLKHPQDNFTQYNQILPFPSE